MFIGTSDIEQARFLLEEYVDNPEDYRFAARTLQVSEASGRQACAVWLCEGPGELWDGVRPGQ